MGKNKSYAKSFDVIEIPDSLVDGTSEREITQEEKDFINKSISSLCVKEGNSMYTILSRVIEVDYISFRIADVTYNNTGVDAFKSYFFYYNKEDNTITVELVEF